MGKRGEGCVLLKRMYIRVKEGMWSDLWRWGDVVLIWQLEEKYETDILKLGGRLECERKYFLLDNSEKYAGKWLVVLAACIRDKVASAWAVRYNFRSDQFLSEISFPSTAIYDGLTSTPRVIGP